MIAVLLLAALLQQPDSAQFEPLLRLGLRYFSEGRFPDARDALQRAVALRPNEFDPRFLLGATLVQLDAPDAAIPHLRQALKLNPAHLDARKLLAAQYLRTRSYKQTIAILSNPADEEAHLLLIEALQSSGDAAGALDLARRAAAKWPQSAQIAAWLGFQMQFAGRYDEARSLLARAIELDPMLPVPYQLMGDIYLKEEDFEKAVDWLARAALKMPDDVETLLSYSRALSETGQTQLALTVLQHAARAGPKDARVHLQLSRLYFKLGDEPRARQAAELSVKLRESNPVSAAAPNSLRSGK